MTTRRQMLHVMGAGLGGLVTGTFFSTKKKPEEKLTTGVQTGVAVAALVALGQSAAGGEHKIDTTETEAEKIQKWQRSQEERRKNQGNLDGPDSH